MTSWGSTYGKSQSTSDRKPSNALTGIKGAMRDFLPGAMHDCAVAPMVDADPCPGKRVQKVNPEMSGNHRLADLPAYFSNRPVRKSFGPLAGRYGNSKAEVGSYMPTANRINAPPSGFWANTVTQLSKCYNSRLST